MCEHQTRVISTASRFHDRANNPLDLCIQTNQDCLSKSQSVPAVE